MQSVWDEQTVKPNEVVLVEDGPLTDELYQAIEEWKERLANTLKVVSLTENVGSVRYYLSFVKLKFSYPSTANINILILKYCQLFLKPFRQRHIIRIHHRNQLTTTEQTVKPNEVVLVEDGPLTDELYQAIEEWKERLANTLKDLLAR
jgi:hypothetical protein